MELIQAFFRTVYNVPELIALVGQIGLPIIVFAETGLLIGFFLPGDSLLITAGLFAARGDFDSRERTRPSHAALPEKKMPALIVG